MSTFLFFYEANIRNLINVGKNPVICIPIIKRKIILKLAITIINDNLSYFFLSLNGLFILINIIPWIGVIIPIVVLFIERGETKRPYVEVSFELVRSTMACLVIRNVGMVPAELKSMTFNACFIQQLSPEKAEILKNKNKMNVTIFPNRYWVLSLDKNVFDVIKFENTKLEVTYTYLKIGKRKEYSDYTEIDFKEYKSFLVYLSEIDEFKNMAEKKLNDITTLCDNINKQMKA